LKPSDNSRALQALNPQQREAVLHDKGPLLILAGAGSGKTRVVTHRMAHLISRGTPAHEILAITFTNKAAGEMKERTEALCALQCPWVSTFHSFAARLLRRHIGRLVPYDSNFSIYDTEACRSVIKDVLKQLRLTDGPWPPRAAQGEISRLKNRASDGMENAFGADYLYGQILRDIYEAYRKRLEAQNAVDFDDLLLFTARLLREHPDLLAELRDQFRYILVDEYQDTNAVQYEITQRLTGPERNICITGDPDQSIYGWRGADIGNILNFETDYPDARVIKLEQNYRSTKNILHVANCLIAHNEERREKELWTENPRSDPVRVYRFADERSEAREISTLVRTLLDSGTSASDIAVFYRINSLSRAIEEELVYANIPYSIVGSVEFFQRKEVKDILAYAQLLDNPRDDECLKRVLNTPPRGIGKTSLERLARCAAERETCLLDIVRNHAASAGLTKRPLAGVENLGKLYTEFAALREGPVDALLKAVIDLTGYESYLEAAHPNDAFDRVTNLSELVNAAREYQKLNTEGTLTGFLESSRLLSSVDRWAKEQERVTLMTLHSAKGLEFPVVILVGVEHGILPLVRSQDPDTDIEEERRLFYVGITRAQKKLYLTHTGRRMRFGQERSSFPSQFLAELQPTAPETGADTSADALELDQETAESLENAGRLPGEGDDADAALLEEDFSDAGLDYDSLDVDEDPLPSGCRVYHDGYGEGEVVRASGVAGRRRVTVRFDDGEEKQFVVGFAPLQRLK